MGLFDKKYCDVCGEKIGFLGNRKLEDGNLCKDCAKKLSPLFDERRHSTVEQIKQQLEYREQNKSAVAAFRALKSYGNGKKIHVDLSANKFVVVRGTNWKDENPDVIDFSQVTSVNTDIKEHKKEIFYRDNDGNQKSYFPKRYEYSYEFKLTINVNSPWFDDIYVELSEFNRPDSTFSPLYNDLMMQMNELSSVLMGRGLPTQQGFAQQGFAQQSAYAPQPNMGMAQGAAMGGVMGMGMNAAPNTAYAQPAQQAPSAGGWQCTCGAQNTANFCQNCGQKKPVGYNWDEIECNQCSWRPEPGQPVPKFCPNCGDPINNDDLN